MPFVWYSLISLNDLISNIYYLIFRARRYDWASCGSASASVFYCFLLALCI